MNNSQWSDGFAFGFCVGMVFLVISNLANFMINTECWHVDCVERGFAEHSQTDGEWQWKVKAENE